MVGWLLKTKFIDDVELDVLGCQVDIFGTNCDQYLSMVQCCFTSTETIRLVRTGSPGRPPRLSHSSWARTEAISSTPTLNFPDITVMVDGLLKNKVSSFHLFSSFPITEHAVWQGQQLWRLFQPTQSGRWQRLPFFSVLLATLARLQETMIGDRNKKSMSRPSRCFELRSCVWKLRWMSWAPVPNKPPVSVDVKQHFSHQPSSLTFWGWI